MKSARAIGEVIDGVSFSFYTPDDVRRLSVKALTNPVTFDELQHPVEGGLYDPSLGPLERKSGACASLPCPCPCPRPCPALPCPALPLLPSPLPCRCCVLR